MNDYSGYTTFAERTRPAITEELKQIVSLSGEGGRGLLQEMITYQLGWSGENAGPKAEGKGIRALLVLLAAEGAGGAWESALPAAAAVELIHNFSLIHDDIEDNSDTRRGRPTVWKIWGIPQAINTGDAMFALANLSLANLKNTVSDQAALQAGLLFHTTCLRLTQGQHQDIHFEILEDVTMEQYWQMVAGKTAALLAFCLEVGAICAQVPPKVQALYRDFGHYLGLAFQAQDDILGIWGEEEKIGKSNTGDLVDRKKTLPVLYGLAQKGEFYQRWCAGSITPEDAVELSQLLEKEGGLAYAQNSADRLTELALNALKNAQPMGQAGAALWELADKLLHRQA
jgi:geranylgeranyl diphosphate synthase type I